MTLLALLGAALVVPGTADAHFQTSRVAVDYRAVLSALPPPARRAATIRIAKSDLALELAAREGHRVVVLGLLGEPFLRVDSAGVALNVVSPTAGTSGLLKALPPQTAAGPVWRLRSRTHRVAWHDPRLRGLPNGIQEGSWSVPVLVDGRRVALHGEIRRIDRPSFWPWLLVGAPFVALAASLLIRREMQLMRAATVAFGLTSVIAMAVEALGFAFAPSASSGKWVEGGNEIVFALVGLGVVVLGSRDARAVAGAGLGLLGLAVGVTKLPVLAHGVVLTSLPYLVARLAVALAIWSGLAAVVLGAVVFLEVVRTTRPAPSPRRLSR